MSYNLAYLHDGGVWGGLNSLYRGAVGGH